MTGFATEFIKSMGPQVSTQLAGTLGIKKQQASQLIPSVLGGIGDLFAAKAAEKTADPRLGGLLGGLQGRPPKRGR